MNNFRNQYVYPDSFQGKVYDYYRNQTNPIHFSIDNQGGFEQKENQQSRKKNEYDKTKKHSLYINNQFEKINDSKPVIFSPPNVDSIEKPLNENTSDELSFNNAPDKNSHIEKEGRKEVVSNLIKEFSLMLEDTLSIQEGFTTLPESEFDNDSLLISSESTSTPENNLGDENTNDPDYKNVTENHVQKKHKKLNGEENNKFLNENTGTMEDKFIILFSESDESQEVMQDMTKEEVETYTDTIEDNFFALFSESDESQEEKRDSNKTEREIDALNENTDTLEDKFITMLLESDELLKEKQDSNTNEAEMDALDESTETMVDKFITMLSESDELEEERQDGNMNAEDNDAFDENTDTLVDKFFTMLSKSDKLQEEKHERSFTNLKDKKSDEQLDLAKSELLSRYKKSSFEKKRKYCINKNKRNKIACFKEIGDEHFFKKNTYIEKKKTTTVKMPVLLTELETDVDIVELTDLLMPLDNILRVEWSVQSLDCKVVLPSKTAFLKGEFIAEIEFSNKELEKEIQSLKITIPWKKTENIHWLSVPDIPHRNQKEFMFQSQQDHNSNYHYEAYQKFAEPIQSQLKQVHFVWHQELNSTEKQLQFNGVAQLTIHLMQDQFIELDCYSK